MNRHVALSLAEVIIMIHTVHCTAQVIWEQLFSAIFVTARFYIDVRNGYNLTYLSCFSTRRLKINTLTILKGGTGNTPAYI